jgi:hypothetical protein
VNLLLLLPHRWGNRCTAPPQLYWLNGSLGNFLPWLALNCSPRDFYLPNRWHYRLELPHQARQPLFHNFRKVPKLCQSRISTTHKNLQGGIWRLTCPKCVHLHMLLRPHLAKARSSSWQAGGRGLAQSLEGEIFPLKH